MISVANCLRQHAPAYLAEFGESVPLGHRKVLAAIMRCRTGELGGVLYRCEGCGREHWVGRSCGNRHCPTCGRDKTTRWLEKQARRLLPVHHFLVTFADLASSRDRNGQVARHAPSRRPWWPESPGPLSPCASTSRTVDVICRSLRYNEPREPAHWGSTVPSPRAHMSSHSPPKPRCQRSFHRIGASRHRDRPILLLKPNGWGAKFH